MKQPNIFAFLTDLLYATLKVHSAVLTPPFESLEQIDFGLRRKIWSDFDYQTLLYGAPNVTFDNSIYFMEDNFYSHYIIFKHPEIANSYYYVGPFLTRTADDTFLSEILQKNQLSENMRDSLRTYYDTIPQLEMRTMIATLNTIGSYLYGGPESYLVHFITENWGTNDVSYESSSTPELYLSMDVMEERYRMENELLEAISRGDRRNALKSFHAFSCTRFENRTKDLLRDAKNRLVILNTLCRKAAEKSFVHPIYLNEISTSYALQIEDSSSVENLNALILDMIRRYCLLVQNQSMMNYSPVIRKALNYIHFNLHHPLSLKSIAEVLNVNPNYLSTIFKKELEITLTEFINQQRIHIAVKLLNTTDLQIQDVAWNVGMNDVNYFTKLFKKAVGVTPSCYKKNIKRTTPYDNQPSSITQILI